MSTRRRGRGRVKLKRSESWNFEHVLELASPPVGQEVGEQLTSVSSWNSELELCLVPHGESRVVGEDLPWGRQDSPDRPPRCRSATLTETPAPYSRELTVFQPPRPRSLTPERCFSFGRMERGSDRLAFSLPRPTSVDIEYEQCDNVFSSPPPSTGLCPDWEDWDPRNAKKNAKDAMDNAEEWLDVPQVSHEK